MRKHCAWCGDPGDVNGSHSICERHAQELRHQWQVRKAARRSEQPVLERDTAVSLPERRKAA